MRIIRGQLAPFGVALPTRWNTDDEVVETSPDGGATWTPNPNADRRTQVLLPPLDTADPRCDAAANLTVAIHEEIDAIILQMNQGADVLALSTGFVAWLLRYSYPGWIISLVFGVMSIVVDAGAEDIEAAFTAAVYEDLQCYFYGEMDAEGKLTEAAVAAVAAKLYADQVITVYNVLSLVFFYSMGFGGLTDAAASGSETGDCAACPSCGEYVDSLNSGFGPKSYVGTWNLSGGGGQLTPGSQGEWIASGGHSSGGSFRTTARGGSNRSGAFIIDLGQDCAGLHFDFWLYPGANLNSWYILGYTEDLTLTINTSGTSGATGWSHKVSAAGYTARYIAIMIDCNLTAEQLVRISDVSITFP